MSKTTPQVTAHPDWEALSSLADGELEDKAAAPLLAALSRDSELRIEWTMLHIVGDALRSSEVAAVHSDSFCARVRAALEQEPTVLAPSSTQPKRARLRTYLLPGAAIAASAAVIGFVAVPLLESPPAVQQAAVTVSPPQPTQLVASSASGRRAAATVANARALDVYLAAHRELAAGVALPRATPYLRMPSEVAESR
jgi:sigma-E factor negative regulatory protein RseA